MKIQDDSAGDANSPQNSSEIPAIELSSLPLGLQKIYVRPVMPLAFDKIMQTSNDLFRCLSIPSRSAKPITKIVAGLPKDK